MADKKYGITLNGQEYEVAVTDNGSSSYTVGLDGSEYNVTVRSIALDNISNHVTGLSQTTFEYTGSEIKPTLVTDGTVTLNKDYTVTYSNNINVGTGSVTVKAKGSTYTGTVTYEFTIKAAPGQISAHLIGLEYTSYPYTGSQIKPVVQTDGTVAENTDYTVTYGENIQIGTDSGTVTVTGIGDYQGTVNYTFNILGNIADHVTGLEQTSFEYTGEEIYPELTTDGTVTEYNDYEVAYTGNVNVGTGAVTVTGINDYAGSAQFEFTITAADITSHINGLEETSFTYTGGEITPAVSNDGTVTLDTDYTVDYSDNKNVGTGKATVTGINNYTNSSEFNFTITAADISSHITGLEKTEYDYTGEEIKPTVVTDGTVTLDTDYTVAYTDNKEVGTGKVTITGINNYTGTKELTFTIKSV